MENNNRSRSSNLASKGRERHTRSFSNNDNNAHSKSSNAKKPTYHYKTKRSITRSRSNSTSKTFSEFSDVSLCEKFGLEAIMEKFFKSKIFICADQCYSFDGTKGIHVSYKFIIASKNSPYFPESNYEDKIPIAIYESDSTPHIVKDKTLGNITYGNSRIALHIFEGYVIFKRDMYIPYISYPSTNSKGIFNNKVHIELMIRRYSNNEYKIDGEKLDWPYKISTCQITSDLTNNGYEVHFKDVMETWYGLEQFQPKSEDYNIGIVTSKEKESFHRSSFEMKNGEKCSKISRKLVFPSSTIGETFEVAYTKEFFMNYIEGKWIKESEHKSSSGNNTKLGISNLDIDMNDTIKNFEVPHPNKENTRNISKSVISRETDKSLAAFGNTPIHTLNKSHNLKTQDNTLIPIDHSTPKVGSIGNRTALLKSRPPKCTIENKEGDRTMDRTIYHSMLVNDNITIRSQDTSLTKSLKNNKINVSKAIDQMLGDVKKHASNIVDIVNTKNGEEGTKDISLYYSGRENLSTSPVSLKIPKMETDSNVPIIFQGNSIPSSPFESFSKRLDTTQESKINLTQSPMNVTDELSLRNGKSLSTIKEMSLEQTQLSFNNSKGTIPFFSSRNINKSADSFTMNCDVTQNSEIAIPDIEAMKCKNSNASLTNSSTRSVDDDSHNKTVSEQSLQEYEKNIQHNVSINDEFQRTFDLDLDKTSSSNMNLSGLQLNKTQESNKSTDINNSFLSSAKTPLNVSLDRPAIMKSIVRDSPNIARPKTPASINKSNFISKEFNEKTKLSNVSEKNSEGRPSNFNISTSYLQTSRILQTPVPAKRATSAFGLRGDTTHITPNVTKSDESVISTPKSNQYRALSATPTKKFRSSSFKETPVKSVNQTTPPSKKREPINSTVSPFRGKPKTNYFRESRDTSIKNTPSSKTNEYDDKNVSLSERSNKSNTLFRSNEVVEKTAKDVPQNIDLNTLELIKNMESFSLQKMNTTFPVAQKRDVIVSGHLSCSTITNTKIDKNICEECQDIKIETLILINNEAKRLTHCYTFNGYPSKSNIKILSIQVDDKMYYKSNEAYNINFNN
uniref:Ubiquitin carboxyl-terminal hydrolase n=1 Tax=Parastrongyloides trichosuri TaxID=131310 RepID=A0A0N4ZSN2_PARTI